MTAYARLIATGKNNAMPKVVRMPVGVRNDGTAVTAPVAIFTDEAICPDCKGWGEVECSSINPSIRDWTEHCDRCDGSGIITIENTSAPTRCLPVADVGSPVRLRDTGLPTTSGMKPDAVGAADQLQIQKAKTPTVLRLGVPKSSASRRPAEDMPPDALPGTLADRIVDGMTVIGGLAVFGMIGYLFLVIA